MKETVRALMLTCCLSAISVCAQVVVDVSGAMRAAQPIAVLPIQGDPGVKMEFIIASDLHKTGLFQPVAPEQIRNRPNSPAEIDYAEFSGLGASYVALGRTLDANGSSAQFVLTQVANKKVIFNEQVSSVDARATAHLAADLILQRLTGVQGAFSSKVAYVLEQANAKGRLYSLIISDFDGANRQVAYSSAMPIVSPSWSRDGRQIAFMTYARNHAQLVVQDVASGSRRVVAEFEGTASSPSWSPEGRQLAISRADEQGNMDIYLLDLASGAQQRITNHAAIDTEPEFSPDGRFIYFTSDRAGNPQIYRMDRSGGNVNRAVVGGNYSTSSELSPDGQSMVLTRQSGGGYQIGLYQLGSGSFQALTNGRLDEGATFSPNGQMIMYTATEGGRTVIKMINLKGGVTQTLSDPSGRLRDPAWGPSLVR